MLRAVTCRTKAAVAKSNPCLKLIKITKKGPKTAQCHGQNFPEEIADKKQPYLLRRCGASDNVEIGMSTEI